MAPRTRKVRKTEEQDKENLKSINTVKTRGGSLKLKAGSLQLLTEMPLDVLFEISSLLNPLDLIHLSRINKTFRLLLMQRSAAMVWKAALSNIPGLPEYPKDICEPAFAALAFVHQCTICFNLSTRGVDWALRARLCSDCFKKELIDAKKVVGEPDDGEHDPSALAPWVKHKNVKKYSKKDLHSLRARYKQCKTVKARAAFAKAELAVTMKILEHAERCAVWAQSQLQDRSLELQQIREHRQSAIVAKLVELGWGYELSQLIKEDDIGTNPWVRQPQKFTERIWSNMRESMVAHMEKMKVKRLKREHDVLVSSRKPLAIAILRAYKKQNYPYLYPEGPDFCEFPALKQILSLPANVEVTAAHFSGVIPLLPSMISEWREKITGALVRSLGPKNLTTPPKDIMLSMLWGKDPPEAQLKLSPSKIKKQLGLATFNFRCRSCAYNKSTDDEMWEGRGSRQDMSDPDFLEGIRLISFSKSRPLWYPEVFGHQCLTRCRVISSFVFDECTKIDEMGIHHARNTWESAYLRFDTSASAVAEIVVEVCGLDPKTATVDDMDTLDPRLGCAYCFFKEGGIYEEDGSDARLPVFSWKSAVAHAMYQHPSKDAVSWVRVDGESALSDLNAISNIAPSDNVVWQCLHCSDLPCEPLPMTQTAIKQHLDAHHGVGSDEARRNVDYIKAYTASQLYATSCLAGFSPLPVHSLRKRL